MSTPPLLAELILAELTADPDMRDAVLGDLAEEFHARCDASGPHVAAWWYWRAALQSAFPLLGAGLRRASFAAWLRAVAAVLAGFAALVGLLLVADSGLKRLMAFAGAVPESGGPIAASIALGAACAVVAGWLAGTIGRRAPLASAVSLGMLCLALNLSALARGTAQGPEWYWVTFGIVATIGIVGGGLLRLRQQARSRGSVDGVAPAE